jgi:hypothetical protein
MIDQVQDSVGGYAYINSGRKYRQTIVDDRSPLTVVSVGVYRKGTPSNSLGIEISDGEKKVVGALFASDIPEATGTWADFDVSEWNMTGKNITIALSSSQPASTTVFWGWLVSFTNPYSKGKMYYWYNNRWVEYIVDSVSVDAVFSTDTPSTSPTGACCVGTTCSITTQTGCTGIWKGVGTTCTPNPCIDDTIVLDKAITCASAGPECGDETAKKTTFAIDETVFAYSEISANDLYGAVMKHEWWWNGTKIWEYSWPAITSHTTGACAWTYWDNFGAEAGSGSGYIKVIVTRNAWTNWWLTNTFTITQPSCTSWTNIGDCLNADCYWYNDSCHSTPETMTTAIVESGTYYTGPYTPGQIVEVASLLVKNNGTATGKLYTCSFFNPNTVDEIRHSTSESNDIAPNGIWENHPVATIPNNQPTGNLTVGIKVWGEDETEPNWTNPLNTHIWSTSDNNLLLLAGVAVAGIGLTWYLSKKNKEK